MDDFVKYVINALTKLSSSTERKYTRIDINKFNER